MSDHKKEERALLQSSPLPESTFAGLKAEDPQFGAVFIEMRPDLLRALRAFYPDGPGTLDRALRIHELMADASLAFVSARLSAMEAIATQLLPRCGFNRVHHIIMQGEAPAFDLANARVLVVGKRGDPMPKLPAALPSGFARMRPIDAAAALCPPDTRKLHLFAEVAEQSWVSLSTNNTWCEVPSL